MIALCWIVAAMGGVFFATLYFNNSRDATRWERERLAKKVTANAEWNARYAEEDREWEKMIEKLAIDSAERAARRADEAREWEQMMGEELSR